MTAFDNAYFVICRIQIYIKSSIELKFIIILQGLDIFTKKDTKHAFHLKWSDQPCWAKFLSRITPLSVTPDVYLLVKGRVLHTITGYNFKQDLGQVFGPLI